MTPASGAAAPSPDALVLINAKSGTVLNEDIDELGRAITRSLAEAGMRPSVIAVDPGRLADELAAAKAMGGGSVIVAGGDGTVSSAAAALAGTDVALGVLPAGTFNLFARSIGTAPDLRQAIGQLSSLKRTRVDTGRVNGRTFVHHVSFGIHPRLIRQRERKQHGSRPGKVWNSFTSFLSALLSQNMLNATIVTEEGRFRHRTPAIMVSNNILRDASLPHADRPDQGVLAAYVASAEPGMELTGTAFETALGNWNDNPRLVRRVAAGLEIEFDRARLHASVDGELVRLSSPVRLAIDPLSLNVLAPAA